ncbi:two-component system, sensor histidine kinase [Gammaproteobacteria bacterium]
MHENITERKLTENALLETEHLYRSLANGVSTLIWKSGTDKLCNYFNEPWLRFTGRTLEQEMGNGWTEGVHPDDLERCLQIYVSAFDCRQPFSMDYRLRHADGSYHWISDDGTPSYNLQGDFIGYIGACNDITARKHVEQALIRESEKNLALLRNASDGITIMNTDGNIIEVSDSFCNMLGYPRDELIGMNVTQWDCGFENNDQLMAAFHAQFKSKTHLLFETRHRRKDGSIYDVEISGYPIELGGEQFIFNSSRDITARKQSVDLLNKSIQALRLSEEQMAVSQRISGTGSWLYDIATNGIQASARSLAMFAFPPTEHYLLNDFLSCIQDRERVAQILANAISEDRDYDDEFVMNPADGSPAKIIHSMGKIQKDAQGNPIKIFGFIQDITERKQTEIILRNAKEAAEIANLAKSRFLATMSHEIRTPMNGILGLAQTLLMPNLTDSERQDYVKTILNSGKMLLMLLNDILDIAKVEAGKTKLKFTPLEPNKIVQEIKKLFKESAKFKSLSIKVDCSESSNQYYFGDPYRLRQMLANLVGNAIKFTIQGEIHISVCELKRNEKTATLEFAISDTGIGIVKDVQRILFNPFSQGDSSITRQHDGTGLGLSIVRNFAYLMGGEVGCDSTLGQGSRFWFTIRADLVTAIEHRIENVHLIKRLSNQTDLTVIPAKLSGRVLVVEDNLINCKVIEALLRQFGVTVTLVKNGQQALDAIMEGNLADLILMNLHMPVMDGYTATERIRHWEKENNQPRRPIIALTSDAFDEDKQHCLTTGMDDFLSKPIIIDTLKAVLSRWLNMELVTLPIPEKKSVDVPRVISIISELIPLLVKNKFDAIRHFNVLQEALEGTTVAVEITEVGRLVKEFKFSRALERLHQIITAQGWESRYLSITPP